jgi:hypothetical protein
MVSPTCFCLSLYLARTKSRRPRSNQNMVSFCHALSRMTAPADLLSIEKFWNCPRLSRGRDMGLWMMRGSREGLPGDGHGNG